MGTFFKDWKEIKRTKCEIWSRVMWYYRSVENFNNWKKSEFYSRKNFDILKTINSKFVEQYNSPTDLVIIRS